MKKLIILFICSIFTIFIYAKFVYLYGPENNDLSNNNIVLNINDKDIHYLKFTAQTDTAFYTIWPNGKDTVIILPDTNNIYKVPILANNFDEGKYLVEILNKDKIKKLNFTFTIKKQISVFNVFLNFVLGIVFFMLGLKFSSKGLSRISGYRLKEILWNLSDSPFKGLFAGLILTLMLQSSTVFSVMITSFVSDGLIGITGAISMIAGSAIGTSIVVQIIAFNISFFSIIMIIIGFYFYDRVKKFKQTGLVILGFGFIFFAIQLMANSIMPIKDTTLFQNILIFLQSNLILLFILVSLFTFSVHSSAVIIALVMGLSIAGLLPFSSAIIMIAGANLGTTFTATLASMRGSNKAKYVNFVNISIKLLTGLIFIFIAFYVKSLIPGKQLNARIVANLHLIFNIIFASIILILLPLINKIGKKVNKKEQSIINRKLLKDSIRETPQLALGHISREIIKMAEIAHSMLEKSFYVMKNNDTELMGHIIREDDKIDEYEKEITLFLVQLSEEELSSDISNKIKAMFFIVDEIEHVGDIISKNLMVDAKKKIENNFYFSEEGFKDIKKMYKEVLETYRMTLSIMSEFNNEISEKIIERRESVLSFLQQLHLKHLSRLENAVKESLETSTLHLDILNDYERINFHSYKMCLYIKEKEETK